MHTSIAKRSRRAVVVSAACAGILTFAIPSLAFATTSAELQAEADAALAQLNTMQETLVVAENNYYTALDEQEAAQKAMDEAQASIDETNNQISDVQDKLSSRARNMYRSGASSIIDLLLGSTSFKEFTTNWDLLTDLNNNDETMVQQSKDLREQLEEEKATYEAQKLVADQKAEEAKTVKEQAETMVASIQSLYNSLSAEASALLQQEMAAQEAAQQAAANAALAQAATQGSDLSGASTYISTDTSTSYVANTSNTATTSNSSASVAYNAATGNSVVDRARSWVGNAQYNFGDCSPGSFDCSGFVSYCLSGSYTRLGSTSTFQTWSSVSDPQPGDVCVNDGHCGIYIGNGKMIHASTYGVGVVEGSVQEGMTYVRYN